MTNNILAIFLLILIAASCTPLPFYLETKECKSWVYEANRSGSLSTKEIISRYPDSDKRYDYYICINKNRHPRTVYADIFYNDIEESVRTLERRLRRAHDSGELVLALIALHKIQADGKYNVSHDQEMTKVIFEAIEKMHGSGWEPLTNKILGQMYPRTITK